MWQLPNSPEAAALLGACWRLGAVAAPLHHRAGTADLDRVIASLNASVVVTIDDVGDLADAPAHAERVEPSDDDLACVLWTAGSSGSPKGVLHSRRALAYKAPLMVGVHGLGPDDTVLMPAPLAHISGLLNGVLVPAAAGMRVVFMSRWDPDEALALIERERITFMVGPPTFFHDLLAAPGLRRSRVASLRLVSCGGSGVTEAVAAELAHGLECVVKRSYGSTEAPTVATAHAGDDPELGQRYDGRAVGDVELRIDPAGELLVRGSELFVGYTDQAATAAAFRDDGWFATGDRATLTDDGWLTILGRADDVIIRAGENIAPAAVEALLEANPAVRHAVVVGLPDARLGERVAAVVVTDGSPFGVDECRAWFEDLGAARFTIPEVVVTVDAIPRLPAGKPDRAAVRSILS